MDLDKIFRRLNVSQFPDREDVDSQSDIRAIVLSIPRLTALRTLRRPVTAKPSDTRLDVHGKAPSTCTVSDADPTASVRNDRRRTSTRVCARDNARYNARRILRQRAACGTATANVDRKSRGRKQRSAVPCLWHSTLTTARFVNVYYRVVKNKRHSCISLSYYFRMSI